MSANDNHTKEIDINKRSLKVNNNIDLKNVTINAGNTNKRKHEMINPVIVTKRVGDV